MTLPFCERIQASSSLRFFAGTDGCTTSSSGETPSIATGAMSVWGLNGIEPMMLALMLNGPAGATNSMWPSAGALTTWSTPMLPFAPGRFSTTNGWPKLSGELLGDDAREQVDRAAGGAGRDDVNDAVRPRLLLCDCCERQRQGQRGGQCKCVNGLRIS